VSRQEILSPVGAEVNPHERDSRFSSLVADIPGVVYRCECSEPRTMHFISDHVEVLTGYPPGEFIQEKARPFRSLVVPEDRELVNRVINEALSQGGSYSLEYRIAHADGSPKWVAEHGRVVVGRDGRPLWIDGVIIESSRQNGAQQDRDHAAVRLLRHVGRDVLTGLPDRTLVHDRTEQMLLRSQRSHETVGAFVIDLDNFKMVNDILGREAGDEVLRSVAARLATVLRASDTLGRFGGDEFVVLAEGVTLSGGSELLAERLMEVLRKPFYIDGFEDIPLSISASIGIATNDRDEPHDLLRDADIALCQAKARGKNRFVPFTPDMKSVAMERLELEVDLGAALEQSEFFLLYQPIFDLDNVSVCGVEALLRWRHTARGIVYPEAFIPTLEETGLIAPVGLWVLQQACRQAAAWHRLGHHLTMSVNVSMRQLETDEFVDHVRETLAVLALEPKSLIMDVAEASLMRNTNATIQRLRKLKDLGVLIAVDDFGTCGSSLAFLRQLPVDALKIDRALIASLTSAPESLTLIRGLLKLGHTLGLETLAEGIEQGWQLESLRNERCEFGQGFLFSQPIAPEALEAILSLEALLA